ncbi:flavin reductase like domain protein [Bradyrhizobium oligotrophicum S58]|uniref:Flavin reductase like domain protein n=1 Tax=Bradyrhizobium oligotrophicum S58 TaxID=1245469 RepID=M4Z1X7_9BRAD|nr:flavin reductase family protein [Bradyrhizobium oligotrophicum]BAM87158.1 flavin reductase like domain protein [Bradyrhizobium oligotrophicum S58]
MSVVEGEASVPTSADELKRAFRDVFSQLASGVSVVTFWRGGNLHGFTATSVTSVSLVPPRVLFCVAQSSRSYASLSTGMSVGISILTSGQRELSDRFASKLAPGSYDDVELIGGTHRAPLIAGALGHLSADIVDLIPSGDHAIVLCDIHSAQAAGGGTPLLYHARNYHTIHQSS